MPKKNRLQLDFSLPTAEERQTFLTKYLDSLTFTPTSSELELMADYVLWGDKNSDEAIELETYWKKKEKSSRRNKNTSLLFFIKESQEER